MAAKLTRPSRFIPPTHQTGQPVQTQNFPGDKLPAHSATREPSTMSFTRKDPTPPMFSTNSLKAKVPAPPVQLDLNKAQHAMRAHSQATQSAQQHANLTGKPVDVSINLEADGQYLTTVVTKVFPFPANAGRPDGQLDQISCGYNKDMVRADIAQPHAHASLLDIAVDDKDAPDQAWLHATPEGVCRVVTTTIGELTSSRTCDRRPKPPAAQAEPETRVNTIPPSLRWPLSSWKAPV